MLSSSSFSQFLLSLLEKAIIRKGVKESDLYDWEKIPNDTSQATTTTSTPPAGQFHTTAQENRADLANMHGSDRVSPTADMLEEHSEQENQRKVPPVVLGQKGAKKGGGGKLGTTDRGVIQKIREVLDAVEKENGQFLKAEPAVKPKQV